MGKKVILTADSTCDLGPQLTEKYGIRIIPLYINTQDASYRDSIDIKPKDIFEYVDKTGKMTKTSAIPVADYYQVFSELTQQGYAVVHFNISSGFSACYQNALQAAEKLEDVYPIDTLNLSTGSGLSVLKAAEFAAEGMEAKQIAEKIQSIIPRVEASFVIDTLLYLHKGGRCSAVARFGANMLKLKPCIDVVNGKMEVSKKFRGKIHKCIEKYVIDRLEGREDIDRDRIFITHCMAPDETVQVVYDLVKNRFGFKEIFVTEAGCTISNHCGPGTLGILFIRK